MASNPLKKLFGRKSVVKIGSYEESTRDALQKAYIPKFLYKPPFGYPRFSNLGYIRHLAKTPYVDMAIQTIIDEVSSVEWDIIPCQGMEEYENDSEKEHIKSFFLNPNTNRETFEQVFIEMPIRDMLEVNAGILNKVFNPQGDLVEIVARDGATFTKNPDIHGMYTNREDVIVPSRIVNNSTGQELTNPYTMMTPEAAREQAAYFQYGWITGPIPVPFGRREIVWLEKKKRTDEHYGESPVQILAEALQMLVYMVESDLDYYNDNNVPKGIIGLEDSDSEEIEAFKQHWNEGLTKKDEFGNYKKKMHKVPIVNKTPAFSRIEFSSSEMQVIEKQKWYTKMIWAAFGVTPVELGYTEDAAGAANQIVQSKVFRKKAVNPLLRILENALNMHVVSEFGYTVKQDGITKPKYEFKFQTFDVEDERKKYELYKLQTENGLKTVNEVRTEEGLEGVEWGDKPPKDWQGGGNSFNFNSDGSQSDDEGSDYEDLEAGSEQQGSDDRADTKSQDSKFLAVEGKPFAGYDSFQACVADNQDKEDPEGYCAQVHREATGDWPGESEGKASVGVDSPLSLTGGETPSPKKLEQTFKKELRELEKRLKELIESEAKPGVLSQVKSVNDVIGRLKDIVSLQALREITGDVIKASYLSGWEDAEKKVDRNFIPDKDAIEYITKYTFDNIKGVEGELQEDLRQSLQRGFMEGEGVDRLKKRVSEAIDVHSNRAEMIARTETNRASNYGRLQGFQKAGVKGKKVYNAANDSRTSALCKRLDGQEVSLDENFRDPRGGVGRSRTASSC